VPWFFSENLALCKCLTYLLRLKRRLYSLTVIVKIQYIGASHTNHCGFRTFIFIYLVAGFNLQCHQDKQIDLIKV